MDDITPEQIIAIAFGCFVGASGLGVLLFWWTSPRAFAIFFGCKVRSAPRVTTTGRQVKRERISNLADKLELQQNPILILQDKKSTVASVLPPAVTPMRVYRPASVRKKEFTVSPIRTPK